MVIAGKSSITVKMKVLISGDREWTDVETIVAALEMLPPGSVIVHGNCRGADIIARECAIAMGIEHRSYPAKWHLYGNSAGAIRNREMVREEHLSEEPIELVLAFHDSLTEKSKGTRDMVTVAEAVGIPWVLCLSAAKRANM